MARICGWRCGSIIKANMPGNGMIRLGPFKNGSPVTVKYAQPPSSVGKLRSGGKCKSSTNLLVSVVSPTGFEPVTH